MVLCAGGWALSPTCDVYFLGDKDTFLFRPELQHKLQNGVTAQRSLGPCSITTFWSGSHQFVSQDIGIYNTLFIFRFVMLQPLTAVSHEDKVKILIILGKKLKYSSLIKFRCLMMRLRKSRVKGRQGDQQTGPTDQTTVSFIVLKGRHLASTRAPGPSRLSKPQTEQGDGPNAWWVVWLHRSCVEIKQRPEGNQHCSQPGLRGRGPHTLKPSKTWSNNIIFTVKHKYTNVRIRESCQPASLLGFISLFYSSLQHSGVWWKHLAHSRGAPKICPESNNHLVW